MSALKERAKRLIDKLPEDAVRTLLEDFEDALDLEEAIAQEGQQPGMPLEQFLEELKREGKL